MAVTVAPTIARTPGGKEELRVNVWVLRLISKKPPVNLQDWEVMETE